MGLPVSLPWLVFALAIAALSVAANRQSKKHAGVKNSSWLAIILACVFVAVDIVALPGQWWQLGVGDTLAVLAGMFLLGLANVAVSYWIRMGKDFAQMKQRGLILDGCLHSEGRLQIPKNLVSNGAMALGEEIVFRGLLGIALYLLFGPWVAVVVTAAAFGLLHYAYTRHIATKEGVRPGRYVAGSLLLTTLSPAIFMLAVIHFNSIIAGWLLHWGINCMVGAYVRFFRREVNSEVIPVA